MPAGRPEIPIDVAHVLAEITLGKSVREISRELLVSQGTLLARLNKSEEIAEQYARAVLTRAEKYADEIVEIADEDCSMPVVDKDGNVVGSAIDKGKVAHQALRVDARKWVACKLLPRYKDKQAVEHTGPNGGPIQTQALGPATADLAAQLRKE